MRYRTAAILFLVLAVQPGQAASANGTTPELDGFVTVEAPVDVAESPAALLSYLHADLWAQEGRPTLRLEILRRETGSGYVAEVEMRGYADDALLGEFFRAVIEPAEGGWRIAAMGRKNICARGANAGVPQAEPCP